jgi:ParB-like chromosome segregation protein Spo0J
MKTKHEQVKDIFAAVRHIQFIDRDLIKPNDYNPNKVTRVNLDLLRQSILTNGFTMPIVIRPDMTIIDGYHRWLILGEEPLKSLTGGKIPCVIVTHMTEEEDIYGTITHNRARGTHLLEPMKAVVKKLLDNGETIPEIEKQLGMTKEEIFRLSDFSRDDFLEIMTKGVEVFTKAFVTRTV